MVNVKDGGGGHAPQELETFLPRDHINGTNGVVKYKITPKKDAEAAAAGDDFDPFRERVLEHPTTNMQTLTHLLKASLGTGILAMPNAFMHSGLIFGIFTTILTAFICTHCSYVVVKSAHVLYKRTKKTQMTFAEVAETAFLNGPKWARKFAKAARYSILISLFITYFGTCSVYTVIIAKNLKLVADHYLTEGGIDHTAAMNERGLIAMLLIPLILLSWIPNLKYLAPVSMIANGFMGVGLGITFYYLVDGLPPVSSVPAIGDIYSMPTFFSITIFAMEAIGVVMPLENNMKTPQKFVGICGVLNTGMSGVTLIYMLLGFLGYLRYGAATKDNITLSLDINLIPAQAVNILIALAVFCTFGLQFFVCLEIAWDGIKEHFNKRPLMVNYVLRTVMVAGAVLLAVAVPTIGPFISLIGAFCFSILGLLFPVFIEMITYWDEGFGKFNWMVWKNILICIFGLLALIFGSKSAIEHILAVYLPPDNKCILQGISDSELHLYTDNCTLLNGAA